MKKTCHPTLIFPAAIALLSASSIASANGMYMGAQLGHESHSIELTSRDTAFDETFSLDSLSLSGIAGGVYLGFKAPVSPQLYMGVELDIGFSTADAEVSFREPGYRESTKLEAQESFGFSALVGTDLTRSTSLYGRLGYQRTKYELSVSASQTGVGSFSASDEDDFGGVRFGLGMESRLNDGLALRLEWSYTSYSSETYQVAPGWTEEYDPSASRFQLGMSFYF